jgi:hypothetical protein
MNTAREAAERVMPPGTETAKADGVNMADEVAA